MSKGIFTNLNGHSLVEILDVNNYVANVNAVYIGGAMPGVITTVDADLGDVANNISAKIIPVDPRSTIEVQNNHHITVVNSHIQMGSLEATAGTIDFYNSYIYAPLEHTNIVVGNNSQINITGASDVCIGALTLHLNSLLNFTCNNHNYQIQSPSEISDDYSGVVQIQDANKLVNICNFINNKWLTDTEFNLEEVCYLRDYQDLDKTLVSLFMKQNNMINTDAIDHFIAKNYFKFAGITHDSNLTGSILEGVIHDITEQICSWLDLEDVNLFGDNADQ